MATDEDELEAGGRCPVNEQLENIGFVAHVVAGPLVRGMIAGAGSPSNARCRNFHGMEGTHHENESSGSSGDRVQEGVAFPLFDSLPATAGLSNAEAFQLSVKHALSLLPRMLMMRDAAAAAAADMSERFSLH
jgi:hypothetical protein